MFQGSINVKARGPVFQAYRLHHDREDLEHELCEIIGVGDVQIIGMLEDGAAGDEMLADVLVEHWAPVIHQAEATPKT